jgi:outer membrane lipoprotein-sorting protein
MQGQKYPITNLGIKNLTAQLLEDLKSEVKTPAANNKVQFFKNAKVDGRPATGITITHPERRKEHGFYQARIFIDSELGIPVRIEGYEWPAKTGGKPPLSEEYTYRNLKVNKGLSDFDFSPQNPKYAFE